MNYPVHGANPSYLYDQLKIKMPEEIYDFSVNVNPFETPYQQYDFQNQLQAWLTEYPDPNSSILKKQISKVDNVSSQHLFIGNGAAQCIFLIAQYFRNRKVGIITPTFVEYEKASILFGSTVKEFRLSYEKGWTFEPEEIRSFLEEVDCLYICNPNNPTGTVVDQNLMQRLILLTKETNTYLIIDEAFYDFCSIPCTVVKEVEKHHHVIVLRSLTKMYRLAGIRIGYVVASQSIIQSISAYSPPWSVNRVAQEIALYVLSEPMYSKHIREKIDLERNRVTTELRNLGFTISNSAVNYYLLSTKTDLRESVDSLLPYLLKNGLVPRHTLNFKGLDGNYLRFAVKDYDCNNRLIQLIKGWSKP